MKTQKALPVLAVLAALLAGGCASSSREARLAYLETPLSLDGGDYEIPAVLTLPAGSGPFPAVVMLHGYASSKDEAGNGYKIFAPELAKRGIASIRIDFMGCGESAKDHTEFDLDVGVAEALAAADCLAAVPEIDASRIGIMGWSMGGGIALLTAARDGRFKSLLTWAGAPDLSGVYSPEAYAEAQQNGVYTATFDWRPPLALSRKAFDVAAATDILAEFAECQTPVLAINGSEDTSVPPETAERIQASSSNAASRVLIIPGADHTFNIFSGDMAAFNSLSAASIDWFLETL